jgi:hypothetical protein
MISNLTRALAMLAGLLAMLACLYTPASAAPMPRGTHHAAAAMAADMPCCPEKGSPSLKVCGQPCAVIAVPLFTFAYLPQVSRLRFDMRMPATSGISYDPLAPPPR